MVMDAQVSFSLYFLGGEEGHQETYLREVDAQPINLDKSYIPTFTKTAHEKPIPPARSEYMWLSWSSTYPENGE